MTKKKTEWVSLNTALDLIESTYGIRTSRATISYWMNHGVLHPMKHPDPNCSEKVMHPLALPKDEILKCGHKLAHAPNAHHKRS